MPTVRIGPDYDTLQPYTINDDANPLFVNSPHWTGWVTFRLNYARSSEPNAAKKPQTAYFNGRKRYFSIQTQGRFKATNTSTADGLWTGDEVLFVAETESKIRPPMGAWLAIQFAKIVDPGFTADGITPLFKDPSARTLTASQRRKYFHNPSNRRAVQFHPQNVYSFDFFNDFTNLATMRAEMGVRFDIRGVLNQQPLRFVCTSKDRSAVFFVLEIDYADLQRVGYEGIEQ
ncbi:hypothetical protein BC937DRAFT_87879 [Endogone sp. FLAS-F59071]|nr:hypothetical protein BC937DRAFT_87879 [Endogone sp. FLAS-F59071]|eukprot:RUS19183.1 hypothetical protein BC937DRAFT_87879 [Endogone sp. FLAS-F59071]